MVVRTTNISASLPAFALVVVLAFALVPACSGMAARNDVPRLFPTSFYSVYQRLILFDAIRVETL